MSISPVKGTNPADWPYPYSPAKGGITDPDAVSFAPQVTTPAQQAQARANIGLGNAQPYVACSRLGYGPSYTSNGTDTVTTFRIKHRTDRYLTSIQFIYANFTVNASDQESGPGNTVATTAAAEVGSTAYPVTFSGAASGTLANGGLLFSDEVPVDIPPGDFYSRSCATVTSGQRWCLTGVMRAGIDSYTNGSDVTNGTGILATSTADNTGAFAPIAIIARSNDGRRSVIVIGDSIPFGTGDTRGGGGYMVRGLGDSIPWLNLSRGGTGIGSFIYPLRAAQRMKLLQYGSIAIVQRGINDISQPLATIQANAIALWTMLAARGMKVYACTITPSTTSTDGFRTAGNQSVTANEAKRVGYNDWVRTVPAPLSGYIEIADIYEANAANVLTRNGGRWYVVNTSAAVTGTATSGSTTTLVDSGKSWTTNQWSGYSCIITEGSAAGKSATIRSNNATQLTFTGAIATAVDNTSKYIIQDAPTSDGLHPNNSNHDRGAAAIAAFVASST